MRSSVLFWKRLISRSATVPGRYLCGFLTPPCVVKVRNWTKQAVKKKGEGVIKISSFFFLFLLCLFCYDYTRTVAGADFRAAFVAHCLRGAFPPVDWRAVCFVRAIVIAGRCVP